MKVRGIQKEIGRENV